MSNPLNLPLITDAQASKHVTHNDAMLKLSQAFTRLVTVDPSAANVVLTNDQVQSNYMIEIGGAAVTGREVEFPAVDRVMIIRLVTSSGENVTVTIDGGADTVVMTPGSTAFVVVTATATLKGFFLSSSTTVETLLDLTDSPANYTGSGGKLVAVKADLTGVEFISPPSGGATEINDLTDVIITTPIDGNILEYSVGFGWLNVPIPIITTLAGLSDVQITTPLEGQAFVWDAAEGEWVNRTIPGLTLGVVPAIKTADYTLVIGDTQALILLEDCDLTVPAHADVALPVGTTVAVSQWGAVASLIVAAAGVTVNSADTLTFAKRYAGGSLVKVLTNTWLFTAYTTEV